MVVEEDRLVESTPSGEAGVWVGFVQLFLKDFGDRGLHGVTAEVMSIHLAVSERYE